MPLILECLSPDCLSALVALEATAQSHPWTRAQWREAFEDDRASLWGAWSEVTLLGYAVLYKLPFEAELQILGVAPTARRRGIARALLERLVAQGERWGSERLLLEVRESNRAARRLYGQAGFVLDGRRRGYYRVSGECREDALLMSLRLAAGKA